MSLTDSRSSIAKIAPPRLPKAVARTRLFKLLDQSRRRPLVWISAPAGAGKTTLVDSYTHARELPLLWYQLDDGDADIGAFFHYFSLAVAAQSRRRSALPAFTAAHAPSLLAFARRYFEAVAAVLPPHTVIAFDNYQDLPETAALHAVLHQAVCQMPQGVTLCVLSRNDPPPAFAQAQARGQVSILAADALRLTDKESLAMMKLHCSQRITRDIASELHARTGGWAAGVTILLQRHQRDDPALLIHHASQQILFNYLATEVFAQMPPQLQSLLLKTCLLPHVPVAVAERVTGDPDCATQLALLNQRHYFTQRLADRAMAYQYHPLFREFLLAQAQQRLSSDEIRAIKCAAAAAFIHIAQPEHAIHLLMEAEDWEHAVAAILDQAPILISQARNATLARWLNAVPHDVRRSVPWLDYWLGMCELTRNPPRALALFTEAFTTFVTLQDRVGEVHAMSGAMEAIFLGQGPQSAQDHWIVHFEKWIASGITLPSPDIEGPIWARVTWAVGWRKPDHPQFGIWLARAEDVLTRMSDANKRLHLGGNLLQIFGTMGLSAKVRWHVKMLERLLASQVSAAPLPTITFHLTHAYASICFGKTELARQSVRKAMAHAEATGLHVLDALALAPAIYANLLDEDHAAADIDLAHMGEWLADTPEILDTAHFEMLSGWRALSAGNSSTAHDHAQRAVHITQRIGAIYPACLCRYGLAHVLVELGNYNAAQAEIDQARLNPSAAYGPWMNYQCDMLLAHLEFRRRHDDAAAEFLRAALTRGRECGFSQPFWFRPAIMAELCARALEQDIETEHVRTLIKQRRLVLPTTGASLSKREIEILILIAKGLSRGQAAVVLGIGVRTIATHVGSIYSKLDISSRAEATAEAIRRGLMKA